MKIDHIGIAVKNLDRAVENYRKITASEPVYSEYVVSQKVNVVFFETESGKIELLSSEDEDSAIYKFLEKRGEGIHHMAFMVKDIYESMADYKYKGYKLLSEKPLIGAANKWVAFIHPKDCNGVLIELCEKIIKE